LGAPIGTISCYAVILVLNMIALTGVIKIRFSLMQYIIKPLISVVLMGACAIFVYNHTAILGGKLALVISIASAAVVYVAALLLTRTVSEELLCSIPGLSRLVPLFKKIRII